MREFWSWVPTGPGNPKWPFHTCWLVFPAARVKNCHDHSCVLWVLRNFNSKSEIQCPLVSLLQIWSRHNVTMLVCFGFHGIPMGSQKSSTSPAPRSEFTADLENSQDHGFHWIIMESQKSSKTKWVHCRFGTENMTIVVWKLFCGIPMGNQNPYPPCWKILKPDLTQHKRYSPHPSFCCPHLICSIVSTECGTCLLKRAAWWLISALVIIVPNAWLSPEKVFWFLGRARQLYGVMYVSSSETPPPPYHHLPHGWPSHTHTAIPLQAGPLPKHSWQPPPPLHRADPQPSRHCIVTWWYHANTW